MIICSAIMCWAYESIGIPDCMLPSEQYWYAIKIFRNRKSQRM